MPKNRRKLSAQFKAEVLQMVLEGDKPVAEVARSGTGTNPTRRDGRSALRRFCSSRSGPGVVWTRLG